MVVAVTLETVSQLTASGIVAGSAYGLLGVAFALILGVTGRFHFAFGLTYTLAAYAAFTFTDRLDVPFWPSVLLGIAIVTVLGVLIERFVYRPLAAAAGNTALLAIFVAALGIGIAGDNLIRIFWGSQTNSLLGLDLSVVDIGDVTITNVDVLTVGLAVALVVGLTAALRLTGLGRAIKATRANPEMAQIIGINPGTIYLIVFAIGSAFGGVAAALAAVKFSVAPGMGFKPVVFAFVVAFLGGTASSPVRVFLTGVVVGLVESLSSIWLSVRWTQTAVFVILLVYLISLSVDTVALRARHGRRPRGPVEPAQA